MKKDALWPGQIKEGTFALAQVLALASVVRAEVYYAFSSEEPRSTADVAQAIGRSPATVRYHVNELLQVDLIFAVETRKRHARTEDAYVHRFGVGFTSAPPWTPEYLAAINKGFEAIVRKIIRERAAALTVTNLDPSLNSMNLFRIASLRLREPDIAELRTKLAGLVFEYIPRQSPDGIAMEVAGYMSPTKQASEKMYFELTGKPVDSDELDEI